MLSKHKRENNTFFSGVSIINLNDAKVNFPRLKVCEADVQLIIYCGTKMECLGYIWVTVANKADKAKLYIVRSQQKRILGGDWLNKIKVDWQDIFNKKIESCVKEISSNTKILDMEYLKKYQNVFSESYGKIKSLQARLYLKDGAKPKFVRARRVPFALMEAVEKQLQEQVEEGVLEKVDKSEWAIPFAVIIKSH